MLCKFVNYLVLFLLIIFINSSFSQTQFSYGLKGGVGFWRLTSFETPYYETLDYSYRAGFSFGLFIERSLSKKFSTIGEFSYQKSIVQVTVSTNELGILEQKITNQNLTLTMLLKYKMKVLWNIYALIGPHIAYLTKAEYSFKDSIYKDKGLLDITKNLPRVNVAAVFGLGKEISLHNLNLIIELRAQLGLTLNKYFGYQYFNPSIGSWRNSGLVFLVGYKF